MNPQKRPSRISFCQSLAFEEPCRGSAVLHFLNKVVILGQEEKLVLNISLQLSPIKILSVSVTKGAGNTTNVSYCLYRLALREPLQVHRPVSPLPECPP